MAARTSAPKKANGDRGLAVATRIKEARINAGMTQTALGEALGVSFQQVQKYERGTNRVSSDRLHAIAKALGMPITYFYSDSQPLSAGDDEIVASLVKWMGQDQEARRILAQLPKVRRADIGVISILIERLTAGLGK